MTIKGFLLAGFSIAALSGAVAQGIEYDDMYFNAGDRAKLRAQTPAQLAYNTGRDAKALDYYDEDASVNPTDSYSARNVNPEYTSRSHTQSAQAGEEEYFVDNYQYKSNQFETWNRDYSNWYNNSWYRPNFYGPGINTWNSPYYGYNSWNSPWYDPYWAQTGWSSSFSFHYGRSWNYGWGGNYNYWNRPYYGWDPYYGLAYGYGLGYGGGYWNNYRYPSVIIVNNGESGGRSVVNGKRPTRSSNAVNRTVTRPRTTNLSDSRSDSNGRQADYYNRSRSTSNSTFHNRGTTEQNRVRPSWNNSSANDRYNSGGRTYSTPSTSSPSYTPSTSSPSRSMGSGSTGRSRGR